MMASDKWGVTLDLVVVVVVGAESRSIISIVSVWAAQRQRERCRLEIDSGNYVEPFCAA